MVTSTTELTRSIEEFISLLQKGPRIEAVVLFGSHARGMAYEGSDIDLAVISPDFEGVPLWRRQVMIADLSVRRPRDISPIGYSPSEYHNPKPQSFLAEIVRTGRVIYPATA